MRGNHLHLVGTFRIATEPEERNARPRGYLDRLYTFDLRTNDWLKFGTRLMPDQECKRFPRARVHHSFCIRNESESFANFMKGNSSIAFL